MRHLVRWLKCTRGQNLVEYALILAFVGVLAVIVLSGDVVKAVQDAVDIAVGNIKNTG